MTPSYNISDEFYFTFWSYQQLSAAKAAIEWPGASLLPQTIYDLLVYDGDNLCKICLVSFLLSLFFCFAFKLQLHKY